MRCQSKIEGQRLDIVQLHTEREDLGRQLEYVQGMLAEASITVDVDQHHLADLQRSLDDMHENLQRSKRERDTYKRQAQRQKAAYEDEIRAAHHKLMDLQRALTRETDARRNAQEKLKQTSGQLTQQRAHLEEVVIQQRSAERSLNESTELLGMHTSLHDDNCHPIRSPAPKTVDEETLRIDCTHKLANSSLSTTFSYCFLCRA